MCGVPENLSDRNVCRHPGWEQEIVGKANRRRMCFMCSIAYTLEKRKDVRN
ncbi:hypothetical protein M3J09_003992 [Ascochyta lentis]